MRIDEPGFQLGESKMVNIQSCTQPSNSQSKELSRIRVTCFLSLYSLKGQSLSPKKDGAGCMMKLNHHQQQRFKLVSFRPPRKSGCKRNTCCTSNTHSSSSSYAGQILNCKRRFKRSRTFFVSFFASEVCLIIFWNRNMLRQGQRPNDQWPETDPSLTVRPLVSQCIEGNQLRTYAIQTRQKRLTVDHL